VYPNASVEVLLKHLGISETEIGPIIRNAHKRHEQLRMKLREESLITESSLNI